MFTMPIDKDSCNAFFVVQVTHSEDHGNMALQSEVVPFIPASATKLKIAGNEHTVKIPVLVNTSNIKKGCELLWYVPKKEDDDSTSHKKTAVLQLKEPVRKKVKLA